MTGIDVVVIGAGLAGVTAAPRLTRAGITVEVVEAKDRLGGLSARHEFRHPNGALTVDAGGQYIGPGQDAPPARSGPDRTLGPDPLGRYRGRRSVGRLGDRCGRIRGTDCGRVAGQAQTLIHTLISAIDDGVDHCERDAGWSV